MQLILYVLRSGTALSQGHPHLRAWLTFTAFRPVKWEKKTLWVRFTCCSPCIHEEKHMRRRLKDVRKTPPVGCVTVTWCHSVNLPDCLSLTAPHYWWLFIKNHPDNTSQCAVIVMFDFVASSSIYNVLLRRYSLKILQNNLIYLCNPLPYAAGIAGDCLFKKHMFRIENVMQCYRWKYTQYKKSVRISPSSHRCNMKRK